MLTDSLKKLNPCISFLDIATLPWIPQCQREKKKIEDSRQAGHTIAMLGPHKLHNCETSFHQVVQPLKRLQTSTQQTYTHETATQKMSNHLHISPATQYRRTKINKAKQHDASHWPKNDLSEKA